MAKASDEAREFVEEKAGSVFFLGGWRGGRGSGRIFFSRVFLNYFKSFL